MTKILKILDKEGLSIYRLMQLIGKDPKVECSFWIKKLTGTISVSRLEAKEISFAMSDWLHRPVSTAELGLEIDRMKFT